MQEKKIFLLKKFALSLHSQSGNNDSDVLVMLKKIFEKKLPKNLVVSKIMLNFALAIS
jgi:hypothetical protein